MITLTLTFFLKINHFNCTNVVFHFSSSQAFQQYLCLERETLFQCKVCDVLSVRDWKLLARLPLSTDYKLLIGSKFYWLCPSQLHQVVDCPLHFYCLLSAGLSGSQHLTAPRLQLKCKTGL